MSNKRRHPDDSIGSYQRIQAERRALPAWEARAGFLKRFGKTDTLVLTGETGCGKTTQIPQFLLAAGYGDSGVIGITQPRRVAAVSVARRVAEELGEEVGERVGYCVRFDECTSAATRIKYMTDGMLLREAVAVPSLRRYSVIIVDEAHERSLQTDMMLALLRRAQAERNRGSSGGGSGGSNGGSGSSLQKSGGKLKKASSSPPLKVIVMSATLDTSTFCSYFHDAPAVSIEGRQFPVSIFYTKEAPPDYLEAAVVAVLQVHTTEPYPGDILCFLPGQDDIEAVALSIKQRWAEYLAEEAEEHGGEGAFLLPNGGGGGGGSGSKRSKHAAGGGSGGGGSANGRGTGAENVNGGGDGPPHSSTTSTSTTAGSAHHPPPLSIHKLYAALPPALQLKALKPAKEPGQRKVILATNIAETSLTIGGVVYVVDTGLAKVCVRAQRLHQLL